MTNESPNPTPSLLTRIEEALKARIAHNDNNSNPCDATALLENRGLRAAIRIVLREFAEPPTDEEVERVARAMQKHFPVIRTGPDANGKWGTGPLDIEIFRIAARAAITADRGK